MTLAINSKTLKGMSQGKYMLTGRPSIDRPWERYYSEEALTTEFPKMTVYDCIYQQNKNHLGRIALEYYLRQFTFEDLFIGIEKAAKSFKEYGVKKGDIVTISMPTTPETVYMFYALSGIGAISNMVDPRTSVKGLSHYLEEVDSKLVVTLDLLYNKIASAANDSVKKIVTVSPADSLPFGMKLGYQAAQLFKGNVSNNKGIKWADFIKDGEAYTGSTREENYQEGTPVSIVHTGGTTGEPKGVLLSNDSFNAIAYQYKVSGMHLIPGQRFMDIMPPFIAYGLGCGIHMPLVVGMTCVIIPKFEPEKFADYIIKLRPNHMAGVPSHWENLISNKKLEGKDLSFLITAAVGGDGMNLDLEKRASKFLSEHNAPNEIIKGYGITEECSLATACINQINEPGSVGIPLPQNVVSIFEPDTEKELSYGEEGEICITGPTLMAGYYNNQEATDKILKRHKDGRLWIHTQDIGYMTDKGLLYVKGRIKRMIIRHDGFKVFPFKIEETIAAHPAVKECMVVGVPDTNHCQGFLPKAHVVLKEEFVGQEDIVRREIAKACTEKLPEYVVPTEYKFRDSIPVTNIGKLDFKALEAEDAARVIQLKPAQKQGQHS